MMKSIKMSLTYPVAPIFIIAMMISWISTPVSSRTSHAQSTAGAQMSYSVSAIQPSFAGSIQPVMQTLSQGSNGKIIFTSERHGNAEIYTINPDGSNEVNLTNNPARDVTPVWSPDGTRIAFASNRGGSKNIYVMNADGTGVMNGTNYMSDSDAAFGIGIYDPTWSPDGARLAYVVSSFGGEISSLIIAFANPQIKAPIIRLGTFTEVADPAWSPDGTRIALFGREAVFNPEDPIRFYLYVININGSGQTRIASLLPDSGNSFAFPPNAGGPAWSPDGSQIAFAARRDSNTDIYVVNASGGPPTRLTDHPATDTMPVWSPDGTRIAFTSNRDGRLEIYVMNADGSQQTRITNNGADNSDPDWQNLTPTGPIPSTQSTIQFRSSSFRVREDNQGGDPLVVTRLGDLSREATVDYTTSDACLDTISNPLCTHLASERSDYLKVSGTLRFAPGEGSKTINVPIIDDTYVEGDEFFNLILSNPTGASLGGASVASVVITDNDFPPFSRNRIDDPSFFVRTHYLDFLSREPEQDGFNAWLGVLSRCPNVNNDPTCDRIEVSAAFFRSPEFHLKGYFVYLFYKVSLGRRPTYTEFLQDLQKLAGQTGDEVSAHKALYTSAWLQRADFRRVYDALTDPAAYVDKLLQVEGVTLTGSVTRNSLVQDLQGGRRTREDVLRAIVEHPDVDAKEYNGAFVTMQYFGYLKRDPEPAGYEAWLRVMDRGEGYRVMVNGFLNSSEYRARFGQP